MASPRENSAMSRSLVPRVLKVFMAVGNIRAATLSASSFKELPTVDGLKFCSSRLMPPKKKPIPTMSTLLEMTAPMREVCTIGVWCLIRAIMVMTNWTTLLEPVSLAYALIMVDCAYPNVITINIPSWPPLLITSSSVTASSIWPRGMIATKLTAKVMTGLWSVYFTANPAGTADMRKIVIHDANDVALNPPQTVYFLSFVWTSLVLCSSSPRMLASGNARESTLAPLVSSSSNRTCLSTGARVSTHRAISTSHSRSPKWLGTHPFKHALRIVATPLFECFAKDQMFSMHCKIFALRRLLRA